MGKCKVCIYLADFKNVWNWTQYQYTYIIIYMYVRTFNCTTIGYVRLHASIAGKQAQLVRFSRIIKIYFSHGKLYCFFAWWIICFCYMKWCTWSWKSLLFSYPVVWFSCRKWCTWSWKSLFFIYPVVWFSCRKWGKSDSMI